jgi:hypothetical protein
MSDTNRNSDKKADERPLREREPVKTGEFEKNRKKLGSMVKKHARDSKKASK